MQHQDERYTEAIRPSTKSRKARPHPHQPHACAWHLVTSSLHPAVPSPSSQVAPETPVDVVAHVPDHRVPSAATPALVSMARPTDAARIYQPAYPRAATCGMNQMTAHPHPHPHYLDRRHCETEMASTLMEREFATWGTRRRS